MKTSSAEKLKRMLKKAFKKLLEMLIELGKESPMAPVWKPRKRFNY